MFTVADCINTVQPLTLRLTLKINGISRQQLAVVLSNQLQIMIDHPLDSAATSDVILSIINSNYLNSMFTSDLLFKIFETKAADCFTEIKTEFFRCMSS